MRAGWLIFLGITVLGCKDKPASQPTEQHSAPPAGSAAQPGAPSVKPAPNLGRNALTEEPAHAAVADQPLPPAADALAREFAAEPVDADWATNASRGITATAPDLKAIECRSRHCRATLTGASEKDVIARVEKLQSDTALRGMDATSVIYTGAETGSDGTMTVTLFVRFDR